MFTPHHVGIVVSDLEKAMDAYIEDFGYQFYQFEVSEKNASLSGSSPGFLLRFGMGQLGLNLIELIQPVSGTTVYSQYLAQKGPGLHHLGFSTPDVAAARTQFESRGCKLAETGRIKGLVDFSYYDTIDLACTVELLQLSCDLLAFLFDNAQAYAPTSK